MKRTVAHAAIALVLAAALNAQETSSPRVDSLSIDLIMRGPQFAGYAPRDLRWSPDGRKIFFRWKEHTDAVEKDFSTWMAGRDGKGLRRLTDEEAKDAPPVRGAWSRDRKRVVYADAGDVILWDGKHRKITDTFASESNPRFTHDERGIAFVRDNNLYVVSLVDGSIVQKTNIAGPDDRQPLWDEKKGTDSQEWVKAEERKLLDIVARRAAKREEDEAKAKKEQALKPFKLEKKQSVVDLQLTPDGRFVIASITTEADKAKKTIVPNYVTESAYTEDITAREKVGDALPVTRLASISTTDGAVTWFTSGLHEPVKDATRTGQKETESKTEKTETTERTEKAATPKERDVTFGAVLFSEDGKRAVVPLRSRDNKDWWLFAYDPQTGKGTVLATVHDDRWVRRMQRNVGWLPDNTTVWFVSEATGWAHLWFVSATGGEPRQMTSGQWEVEDVALSDDRRHLLLTTSETSLYERHLFRMPVAGGDRVRLTRGSGRHEAVVSPDGLAFADIYSYANVPPEVYVGAVPPRSASPSEERVGGTRVTSSPSPAFTTYRWIDPPIVTFRASDGVDVPARLYKPAGWQRGGPVVIFVHGAGYLQNVHRWWSDYYREYMFHHFLLEHGYLVLDIDYRASAGYGRDWRTAIYRHMGGRDLADHTDAARWLASEHGVDPKRLGIYGGSYGGFITLMALFTEPDVFRSGAALRPVTDWAHYNHGYTSDILNTPQSDPEAFRRSSPIHFAAGLKGSLLMCHGVVDVNVHFQDTVRLAQKLIELRKEDWEVAMYPVEDHTFVEPASWADEFKRVFKLFERTLK